MIVNVFECCDQRRFFIASINLVLFDVRMMQQSALEKIPALVKSSISIKSIEIMVKRGFKECLVDALLRYMNLFLTGNLVRKDYRTPSKEDHTFAMRLFETVVGSERHQRPLSGCDFDHTWTKYNVN